MEGLVEALTRGNPTEVKVVLASVGLALAAYQLVLIAVAYREAAAFVPGLAGGAVVSPGRGRRDRRRAGGGQPMTGSGPPHERQMLGSLLVALAIVAAVIVAVTLRLGPTSVAELEAMQEREELRIERQEELREARQERREEELEAREEIEEDRREGR